MTKSQSVDPNGFGRSAEFRPSLNHRHALNSAIGIRSSDTRQQPDLPHMVRSPQAAGSLTGSIVLNSMYGEGVGQFSHSHSQLDHSQSLYQNSQSTAGSIGIGMGMGTSTGKGSPVRGGALEHGSFSSGYDANEVRATIAERERHFFKEVSLNPNLKDQHPLMHLISAQQKLKLIDEQSGVLASKTADKSESIFGTRYGKQTGDKFHKNGAYAAEIPYAVNGEIILPSKLRQRKLEEMRRKKMHKSRSLKALLNPGDLVVGDGAGGGGDLSGENGSLKSGKTASSMVSSNDPVVKSSQKHRDFLAESLQRLEDAAASSAAYVGHYTGGLDDRAAAAAAAESTGGSSKNRSPSMKALPALSNSKSSPSFRGPGSPGTSTRVKSPSSTSSSNLQVQAVVEQVAGEDELPLPDAMVLSLSQSLQEGSTESGLMRQWGLADQLPTGSLTEGSLEQRILAEQADSLLVPVEPEAAPQEAT